MRLVCISDTHGQHRSLPHPIPDGDVLIHAGDITEMGENEVLADFNAWIGSFPHKHKVVVAGNHDFSLERDREKSESLLTACTYLRDSAAEIGGLKFYGSPWTPTFLEWAFMLDRGEKIREAWDKIPAGTEILITHGPVYGILDRVYTGPLAGCEELLKVVQKLKPQYHIFGHIHECYGTTKIGDTTFVNASSCDYRYKPKNAPIVIDI